MRQFTHYSYYRGRNYVGFIIVILAILVYLTADIHYGNDQCIDESIDYDSEDVKIIRMNS